MARESINSCVCVRVLVCSEVLLARIVEMINGPEIALRVFENVFIPQIEDANCRHDTIVMVIGIFRFFCRNNGQVRVIHSFRFAGSTTLRVLTTVVRQETQFYVHFLRTSYDSKCIQFFSV